MNYSVVFKGEINSVYSKAQVIQGLAKLFNKPATFIEKLFSGKQVVIKNNIDLDKAKKFQHAMEKLGAIAEIVEVDNNVDANEKQHQSDNTDNLSMAETGATITESEHVSEPDIDISTLSMSDAGSIIVEAAEVEEAQINDVDFGLAPTGSTIVTAEPVAEPDIDTSHISLDDERH